MFDKNRGYRRSHAQPSLLRHKIKEERHAIGINTFKLEVDLSWVAACRYLIVVTAVEQHQSG